MKICPKGGGHTAAHSGTRWHTAAHGNFFFSKISDVECKFVSGGHTAAHGGTQQHMATFFRKFENRRVSFLVDKFAFNIDNFRKKSPCAAVWRRVPPSPLWNKFSFNIRSFRKKSPCVAPDGAVRAFKFAVCLLVALCRRVPVPYVF